MTSGREGWRLAKLAPLLRFFHVLHEHRLKTEALDDDEGDDDNGRDDDNDVSSRVSCVADMNIFLKNLLMLRQSLLRSSIDSPWGKERFSPPSLVKFVWTIHYLTKPPPRRYLA